MYATLKVRIAEEGQSFSCIVTDPSEGTHVFTVKVNDFRKFRPTTEYTERAMDRKKNEKKFDVVGVGNAIVDVLSVEESFIQEHQLIRKYDSNRCRLRAQELYEAMPPGKRVSGSAANTMVGVACLEGFAAYIGKVNDDPLGNYFSEDIRDAGVDFRGPIKAGDIPTARCLIQVTPDAQRTMNTFLGVSSLLDKTEIDEDLITSSGTLYCEGYYGIET